MNKRQRASEGIATILAAPEGGVSRRSPHGARRSFHTSGSGPTTGPGGDLEAKLTRISTRRSTLLPLRLARLHRRVQSSLAT